MTNHYYSKPGTRGVFAIIDPRNNKVVFVGSSDNIEALFATHFEDVCSQDTTRPARAAWKKELLASGVRPVLDIIAPIPSGSMTEIKQQWVRHYISLGEAHLNIRGVRGVPKGGATLDTRMKAVEARIAALEALLDPLLQ